VADCSRQQAVQVKYSHIKLYSVIQLYTYLGQYIVSEKFLHSGFGANTTVFCWIVTSLHMRSKDHAMMQSVAQYIVSYCVLQQVLATYDDITAPPVYSFIFIKCL